MNFNSPPATPVEDAQQWFDYAESKCKTPNPLAVALSTVDAEGNPSSRMVLLKGFDACGAVFYTNYTSEKAMDIEGNNAVSLLFHWDDLQRQLRIQGRATKLTAEESDAYYATRAKLSQVGAWASKQSKPLKSRAVLMAKVAALTAKWVGRKVPRPEFWGGYDRIRYTCIDGVWSWQRLQP